ncbi:MAG: cupin domain-containing protein [Chloroflexi bacterium]|nr:cupin domain-containing protein [Chloroflexota bacterium]
MLKEKTLELYSLTSEEGQAVWFLGIPTFIKATGEQTGEAFGLIEQVVPVGFESPYHVHHTEEEIFFILEGELTFISGERRMTRTAGSYTFLPRDIPHGFKVIGDKPARFFILTTPAGFEQFVIDMSKPEPPAGPPDMDKLMSLAAKYNIEILGPLPD